MRTGFVIGRLLWDEDHPSPWMSFRNITEFRAWQRDIRKVRPKTKCEHAYVDRLWTADAMLRHVRERSES